MIVEQSLGNIDEPRFSGLARDYLDIEWFNINKRIDRKNSRGGIDVGLRMDDETFRRGWRQGDVIWADEKSLIAIEILPCRCILIKGVSEPARLARLGYEIGNRHAPFFFDESAGEFLLPYDEPTLRLLEKLGFKPELGEARLHPELRLSAAAAAGHAHSGHDHSHGEHGHSHDHGEHHHD
jgi:urease accessory protein